MASPSYGIDVVALALAVVLTADGLLFRESGKLMLSSRASSRVAFPSQRRSSMITLMSMEMVTQKQHVLRVRWAQDAGLRE